MVEKMKAVKFQWGRDPNRILILPFDLHGVWMDPVEMPATTVSQDMGRPPLTQYHFDTLQPVPLGEKGLVV